MKKILSIIPFFTFLMIISCGEKESDVDNVAKDVVTVKTENITMNGATLYGHVDKELLSSGSSFGFILSTFSNPTSENGQVVTCSEVDKDGNFFAETPWLSSSTTYYYKVFVEFGSVIMVGNVKSFATKELVLSAVDMGLSVKWANANLGATSIEANGDYYAWGETEIKKEYNWTCYKWYNKDSKEIYKYNLSPSSSSIDYKTTLESDDDAARVKLGGGWRMPTGSELAELLATRNNDDYLWEWKSLSGNNGWMVTFLGNKNKLFLPAAGRRMDFGLYSEGTEGRYWSSNLYVDSESPTSSYQAMHCYLTEYYGDVHSDYRYIGQSIRPVKE